jgi:hypothetical protein
MSNITFLEDILKRKAQQQQPGEAAALPIIGAPTAPVSATLPQIAMPDPANPMGAAAAPPPIETLGGSSPIDPAAATAATAPLPAIGPTTIAEAATPEARLAELDAKDYTIRKDDQGNVVHRGKDRDKKWSTMDKVLSALSGWATGGLVGGVKAATDRNYFEKMGDSNRRAELLPQIAVRQQQAEHGAKIRNIDADNEYQRERLKEYGLDRVRKEGDREARTATARMNAVAGMFKDLPVYNPADPKFAEMTKALGDVDLPISPKDAKKNVQLKQDQRSGAWTVILTDPITGAQEARDVVKNGQPFKSTPTVVMQGERGLLRQDDAQAHQATEAQKTRQFQSILESAKLQAQGAFAQLRASVGEKAAADRYRANYVSAFQKANGRPPTAEETAEYMAALQGQ